MKIQIHNKNFDLTDPFKEYLEEKFQVLDKYQMDILGFHVGLSRDQKHHRGDVFNIEVRVSLPNKHNFLVQESHIDAHAAIDLLQTKIARQLVKHKSKGKSKKRKKAKLMNSLKFWQKD